MEIELTNPVNAHVHFRGGPKEAELDIGEYSPSDEIFKAVVPYTAAQFASAIVIGNTKPQAIENAVHALAYRSRIHAIAPDLNAIIAVMITKDTTPEIISDIMKQPGSFVGKLMPANVTTNSERGVIDMISLHDTFMTMSETRMPLLIHAESSDPDVHPREREEAYLPIVDKLAWQFPELSITIEHISSAATAKYLRDAPPNVAASVTYHHLANTWQDLYRGPFLRSDFHCAPCLKDRKDVEAIWELIASGFDRIWFGSDSAPHPEMEKHSDKAPSGIFTEPFVLPGIAQLFASRGLLPLLNRFVCKNAADWYRIEHEKDRVVRLVSETWSPKYRYGGQIACPYSDLKLQWKVA